MGFMDELKKLAKPYTEDEDDFDEFDDDVRPTRASRSSSAPAPSRAPSAGTDRAMHKSSEMITRDVLRMRNASFFHMDRRFAGASIRWSVYLTGYICMIHRILSIVKTRKKKKLVVDSC